MPARTRPFAPFVHGGKLRAARWLAAAALAALPLLAAAQEAFPSRPVRLIVPVAAGGGIDTAFRAIAPAWSEQLGQQVVVENKPGGGQVLGSDLVAKSKPDGYTLLAAGVPIAFNTALGRKLPYDALQDFTPLSMVVSQPLLVVVNPAVPVKSMAGARRVRQGAGASRCSTRPAASAATATCGGRCSGRGSRSPASTSAYNGITPALKDVMGGQVPLLIDAIVPSGTQVAAGTVRGIAIVASQRAKSLPALATLTEQGFAGFDAAPFYGVLGPAGMDAAVAQKLNASLTKALATPALREKLQEIGFDVVGSTPDAYAKLIRDEIDRWSRVVKEQNIKVD